MLASWNGSDAELAQMASSVDKQVEWMNSPEARDSFAWLLAVEMDRRGMLKDRTYCWLLFWKKAASPPWRRRTIPAFWASA
ncbi:MAG: hypothetical protein ACLT8C_03560 [Akkermansia muciniphila]